MAFGASVASRSYSNAKGDTVEVQITGDSAMVMQFASLLSNPQFAGAMGKLVRVGSQRAIQTADGDVNMVIATNSWSRCRVRGRRGEARLCAGGRRRKTVEDVIRPGALSPPIPVSRP